MSDLLVQVHSHQSQLPLATEPTWAAQVPRWQQLDPASAAVAEAWVAWGLPAPDWFLLANQGASNQADVAFARSGAFSPGKFVATLPSITLSAMLQINGWVGPMICVQNGARTLVSALAEAALLVGPGRESIGIMTYVADASTATPTAAYGHGDRVTVRYFAVGEGASAARTLRLIAVEPGHGGRPGLGDDDLLAWLAGPTAELFAIDAGLALTWGTP